MGTVRLGVDRALLGDGAGSWPKLGSMLVLEGDLIGKPLLQKKPPVSFLVSEK